MQFQLGVDEEMLLDVPIEALIQYFEGLMQEGMREVSIQKKTPSLFKVTYTRKLDYVPDPFDENDRPPGSVELMVSFKRLLAERTSIRLYSIDDGDILTYLFVFFFVALLTLILSITGDTLVPVYLGITIILVFLIGFLINGKKGQKEILRRLRARFQVFEENFKEASI